MEDFTQPYASQGDINYSLCLITQGRHSLETEWWKLAPDGDKLFFIKKKKEKKIFSTEHRDVAKAMTSITSSFSGVIWRCYSQVSFMLCLPSKVILPSVTTTITAIVILFLSVFKGLLNITVCLCIAQRIQHRSERTVKQTHMLTMPHETNTHFHFH